ncbi:MAG: LysR family transcriptional regulator [Alphaproteobacteria bacterium]|nr:LysR family transcriptional regulator [Alphaproteobacteria bacterium]
MNVKTKFSILKNLLYLQAVVEAGSISAAASRNGIKASNLSKMIKDCESLFHKVLFYRTAHGMSPTQDTLDLVRCAHQIDGELSHIMQLITRNDDIIKLYIVEGLEIKNLSRYNKSMLLVKQQNQADVIVTTAKPKNVETYIITESVLGKDVAQHIWICTKNTPEAVELARFIILQIHSQ